MKLQGMTFLFAPLSASSEFVIPVWPATERLLTTQLPSGGVSLLTGTTANRHTHAAYERFMTSPFRKHYAFYTCYAEIELAGAIPSTQALRCETLPKTTLLALESLRVTSDLADKVTEDAMVILKNNYKITVDPALAKTPRTFSIISEYPYVIKDLLTLPDYQHLNAVVYVLRPAPGVLKQRYVYLRDRGLVTKLTLAGDDPSPSWRWPTPEEMDQPPDTFNPYADAASTSRRRGH